MVDDKKRCRHPKGKQRRLWDGRKYLIGMLCKCGAVGRKMRGQKRYRWTFPEDSRIGS